MLKKGANMRIIENIYKRVFLNKIMKKESVARLVLGIFLAVLIVGIVSAYLCYPNLQPTCGVKAYSKDLDIFTGASPSFQLSLSGVDDRAIVYRDDVVVGMVCKTGSTNDTCPVSNTFTLDSFTGGAHSIKVVVKDTLGGAIKIHSVLSGSASDTWSDCWEAQGFNGGSGCYVLNGIEGGVGVINSKTYWFIACLPEVCNGVDDNCDSVIDEGCDSDLDHYIDSSMTCSGDPYCTQDGSHFFVPAECNDCNTLDCNDNNAAINPGAAEVCGNGIDDNCDGRIDEGCVAPAVCGNWVNQTGEQCDDGNLVSGDGCSATCAIENGWNCVENASEATICAQIPPVCSDTCESLGNNCGEVEICGETQNCGSCDESQTCETNFWNKKQCTTIEQRTVNFCWDYTDSSACSADGSRVCDPSIDNILFPSSGYTQMPAAGFCDSNLPINFGGTITTPLGQCNYYAENCTCTWDSTTNNCTAFYNQVLKCGTETYRGNCTFATTKVDDKCDTTGFITYTRKATWNAPSDLMDPLPGTCEDSIKTYKCPSTAKLPFFTAFNFVITLVSIIGIYFVLNLRNKKLARRSKN